LKVKDFKELFNKFDDSNDIAVRLKVQCMDEDYTFEGIIVEIVPSNFIMGSSIDMIVHGYKVAK
jgi:hypothetical protein